MIRFDPAPRPASRGRFLPLALALAILLLLAACTADHLDEEADEAAALAIETASRAFSAAYVEGDTTTLAALYTEDALLLPPERELRGRTAIASYFAPREGRDNLSHALASSSLTVSGDMAIDVGTWHNTWRVDDGDPRTASGRYLVVWRRAPDGAWRMSHDMWHRPVSRP